MRAQTTWLSRATGCLDTAGLLCSRKKKKKNTIFIIQRGEPYTRHLWVGSGWVGEWRIPKEGSLICGSHGLTNPCLQIESHLNSRSWR